MAWPGKSTLLRVYRPTFVEKVQGEQRTSTYSGSDLSIEELIRTHFSKTVHRVSLAVQAVGTHTQHTHTQ